MRRLRTAARSDFAPPSPVGAAGFPPRRASGSRGRDRARRAPPRAEPPAPRVRIRGFARRSTSQNSTPSVVPADLGAVRLRRSECSPHPRFTTPHAVASALSRRRVTSGATATSSSSSVPRDITVRYKRSVLGVAWTMLSPLLQMLAMTLGLLRRPQACIPNYPVYFLSGRSSGTFFSQATGHAASLHDRRPGDERTGSTCRGRSSSLSAVGVGPR